MIERVVLLKLGDVSRRAALAEEARRVLPAVPGVRSVTVGVPADADAEVWDLYFVLRFDRPEDVAAWTADPLHLGFADPEVKVRKAWSFLTD